MEMGEGGREQTDAGGGTGSGGVVDGVVVVEVFVGGGRVGGCEREAHFLRI